MLLLSAYDAGSHRQWRGSLCRGISEWHWQILSLPARHFSWRIRGNPLYWSVAERQCLEQDYDLVLATSMVDLATLRGLVPNLAQVPAALYFHENQFAYPENRGRHGLLEAQMVSLYAGLSAQCLLFNSDYNLSTYLEGCERMLNSFPDAVPPGVVASLREKAAVLPVPLEVAAVKSTRSEAPALQLVWNHRWEYDKAPERLLEIVKGLRQSGLDFVLHVAGQQFRRQPPVFAELRQQLEEAGALGQWGYVADGGEYANLLAHCDVALSTALHDFQGLALMQACAAGCSPLAPERLVYPEWLEETCLYTSDEAHPEREAAAAVAKILALAQRKSSGQALPTTSLSRFSSRALLDEYRRVLLAVA